MSLQPGPDDKGKVNQHFSSLYLYISNSCLCRFSHVLVVNFQACGVDFEIKTYLAMDKCSPDEKIDKKWASCSPFITLSYYSARLTSSPSSSSSVSSSSLCLVLARQGHCSPHHPQNPVRSLSGGRRSQGWNLQELHDVRQACSSRSCDGERCTVTLSFF